MVEAFMSELFSPFVASKGTGPDASIAEPRIVRLTNGRLEADGRIVCSTGYEDYTVAGITAAKLLSANENVALAMHATSLQNVASDPVTGNQLALSSPLLPGPVSIIRSTDTNIKTSFEMLTASPTAGALLTWRETSQTSIFYSILDNDGKETLTGSVVPSFTYTFNNVCEHSQCDGYLMVSVYSKNASGTPTLVQILERIYEIVGGALVLRFTRSDSGAYSTSTASSGAEYLYDDGTSLHYKGASRSGAQTEIIVNKSTWTQTTGALLTSQQNLIHIPGVLYDGGVKYLTVSVGSACRWYIGAYYKTFAGYPSGNAELYPTFGIWRRSSNSVWASGLVYLSETAGTVTRTVLSVPWLKADPNSYTEDDIGERNYDFPGPYLNIDANNCITFGGNQTLLTWVYDGTVKGGTKCDSKGVWLISSSSTITLIGSVDLDETSGWACLTANDTVILLGKKTMRAGMNSLATQSWRLVRDTVVLDRNQVSVVAKNSKYSLITGAKPELVNDESSPSWLQWRPHKPLTMSSNVAAGTYLYCYHWVTVDQDGFYINGPVSAVTSSAYRGAAIVYSCPPTGDTNTLFCEIYRTADTGTTFYLCDTVPWSSFSGGFYTSVGTKAGATDASITSNKILYTQGTTSNTSGRYETTSCPPCRYFYRGLSRCIIGGLSRETVVQLSDQFIYGEIECWPMGNKWKIDLDSKVLGVGESDAQYLVFTENGVFTFSDGPDAIGAGEFTEPSKVSAVGTLSTGSVLETPVGWFFQATDHQLYVLRKGSLALEPVSFGFRSIAAGGEDTIYFEPESSVVSSCFDPSCGMAYFVMENSVNTSRNRTLAVDVTTLQMSIESAGPNAVLGSPIWVSDGILRSRAYVSSSWSLVRHRQRGSAGWWLGVGETVASNPRRALTFTTSNLTPWGKTGWGRVREVDFSVTQDDVSRGLDASYSVAISASNDADTQAATYLDSVLQDGVVDFVPAEIKCSDLRLTITDYSSSPLVWHGVQLSTTSAARTRVR
jgi:hypothetical protein